MDKDLLSMAQASKICPYEQGYLSLLARRGEIRAEKIGRNWYTKVDWLNIYLRQKRPGDVIITGHEKEKRQNRNLNKSEKRFLSVTWIWLAVMTLVVAVGFFVYQKTVSKVADIEKQHNQFVPSEIVKIPNDNGDYDVYGVGTIKMGTEKVSN